MQQGQDLQALFSAFSRINQKAFASNTLLSCPTLSKAPNYGSVLRRFIQQTPTAPLGVKGACKLALRYTVNNVGHLLFLLIVRLYIQVLGWKLPAPLTAAQLRQAKKPLVVLDTFAVLPKIAQDKKYTELYMPHLLSHAMQQGMEPIQLFRMYGSRNPIVAWRALKVLALQQGAITEVHLFTWHDWLRLITHLVVYPFALVRLIRSLTHYPQKSAEQAIRGALVSTSGQCVMLGEARRLAGFRLGMLLGGWYSDTVTSAPKIISWYENQTVNKTFHRGVRLAQAKTGKHISIIGTQLFIWPSSLLNNLPDDAEATLGLAPDVTVVSGTAFLPQHSSQRYVTGPSLRYGYLFQPVASTANSSLPTTGNDDAAPTQGNLLVLLSYHPEETIRVLETVLPLANAGQPIVYKFHPATAPEEYAPWLPKNPTVVEGSLQAAIAQAKVVIGSGSGALAEAVCVGVPAITVDDSDANPALTLNYLPQFGQGTLWQRVTSARQIDAAIQTVCNYTQQPTYSADKNTFRSLLFTQPTDDNIIALLTL